MIINECNMNQSLGFKSPSNGNSIGRARAEYIISQTKRRRWGEYKAGCLYELYRGSEYRQQSQTTNRGKLI